MTDSQCDEANFFVSPHGAIGYGESKAANVSLYYPQFNIALTLMFPYVGQTRHQNGLTSQPQLLLLTSA